MSVTIYREVPCDQQIAAVWNELALEMEEPEVFYIWEWTYAGAMALADAKKPFVVSMRNHDSSKSQLSRYQQIDAGQSPF